MNLGSAEVQEQEQEFCALQGENEEQARLMAELAENKTTFSQGKIDAYERAIAEIQQLRDLLEAKWQEGWARGYSAGLVSAILKLLATRSISVSHETRAHLEACRDASTLERWAFRAATAASAEEVIAAPPERA